MKNDNTRVAKLFSGYKKNFNIMVFHKPDYCEDLIDFACHFYELGFNAKKKK